MSMNNGTGVQYPTIELGGVTYTLKFTRGAMIYGLAKRDLNLADLGSQNGNKRIASVLDFLHLMIEKEFKGTVPELADLVESEGKMMEASLKVGEALGKVFPPTIQPAPLAAGETAPKPS